LADDCTFIRARSADQIEARRGEILAAAADMILEEGFDDISLNGIARRAGIAKSNLYRYFSGKEEILFEVMVGDYTAWFDDVQARLEALPRGEDTKIVAHSLSESLRGRERLCTFISVKSLILERNMSEETIERFSNHLMGRVAGLMEVLVSRFDDANLMQGPFIMRAIHASIAGLWPLSQHNHGGDMGQEWETNFHRDLEKLVLGIFLAARQENAESE
jgi:AcrR family transcriptional regulator